MISHRHPVLMTCDEIVEVHDCFRLSYQGDDVDSRADRYEKRHKM
jgi:hypothetical protein